MHHMYIFTGLPPASCNSSIRFPNPTSPCTCTIGPRAGGTAGDGAVVRALASHQCSLGSNPGFDAICGLKVVDSLLCSERFISGYSGFPLSSKTNISKFQFDQESDRRRATMWMCYLQIVIYLFIYFYITSDVHIVKQFFIIIVSLIIFNLFFFPQ